MLSAHPAPRLDKLPGRFPEPLILKVDRNFAVLPTPLGVRAAVAQYQAPERFRV